LKLQTKLTLFNTFSKLVIVVLFVLLLPGLIKNINLRYTDSRLVKQKEKVLQTIKEFGIQNYIYDDGPPYSSYNLLKEEYMTLEEVPLSEFEDTIANEQRKVEKDTIAYRILSHTFKLNNKNYLLEIGKSTDTVGETSAPLQSLALQVLLGMILLTILADLFYTNYILQPLGRIIREKLGKRTPQAGTYQQVKTTTADFKYLDESIHEMMEHIEQAFLKEREFISNASHELMTPISILQSKIENLSDREDISEELQVQLIGMQKTLNRLKRITQTLLLISQIENEQFLKEDSVSVSELVKEVHDEIAIRLQEKNISVHINIPQDYQLQDVNRFLLFNLIFNLLNNAIKYNKKDGEINIKGLIENDHFILEFQDTGQGIAAQDMPYIFNRFKKLRQASPQDSFGLGLPIVKSIADYHRIKIEVFSEVNVGSIFRLIFP
jgi:two-component system sensor histidine kinase ArlS